MLGNSEVSIEFIVELWETMRSFIPAKERLSAADSFVNMIDSYGFADEIQTNDILSVAMPKELKAAIKSRFELGEVADEEDEG